MREFWLNFGLWVRWGLLLVALSVLVYETHRANVNTADNNKILRDRNRLFTEQQQRDERMIAQHEQILERCKR